MQIEVLVGDDALETIGADEELLAIVIDELSPLTPQPHAEILHRLIGTPRELDEARAGQLWNEALTHRRALSEALGRPIHLRTAFTDLLAGRGLKPGMKVMELLEQDRDTDELTGVLKPEVFLALVDHQARQRVKDPAVIACVSLVAQGADGFNVIQEQSILASLAHVARKRFRRSDAIGVFDAGTLSLLLVQCPPEKAATLLRQLEQDVRQAHPELALRLASGVTLLAPNDVAAAAVRRARQRMDQWAVAAKNHVAVQALWPLAVFATTSPTRFLELHEFFAERGWALLMARDRATADQAVRRLQPSVVLADVLLPPGGGLELLENLARAGTVSAGCLVAPARWSSLSRGKGLNFTTLHLPFAGGAEAHLERHLGPPRAPVGPLPSEQDAEHLAAALATLLTGWALPPHLEEMVGSRPELQVAQARLANNV